MSGMVGVEASAFLRLSLTCNAGFRPARPYTSVFPPIPVPGSVAEKELPRADV